MSTSRTIKYLSVHRLEGVELRVMADNENGILPLVEAECQVVTRLTQEAQWPHHTVTLFILSDLMPLQRQLQALGRHPVGEQLNQMGDLLTHPVVNVYDLANPSACQVFVNRQAMVEAGYWNDTLAIQGLLAHEHAHPLAECATTNAVRQLKLTLELRLAEVWAPKAKASSSNPLPAWADNAQSQLNALVRTLILLGPRELFTNEIALATGFVQPMLHLNRQNVHKLVVGLAHRPTLQNQLAEAVRAGQLTATGATALALIGDLQGHLPMAMEVAAFQRQHQQAASEELLAQLQKEIFPYLDAEVGLLFQKFCDEYVALPMTATPQTMVGIVQRQLALLAKTLKRRALHLTYQVTAIAQ